MAEMFWLMLGFIIATFVWHQGFRNWVKSKIWRKPAEKKPVEKDPDKTYINKVKEIERKPPVLAPKSDNSSEHDSKEI